MGLAGLFGACTDELGEGADKDAQSSHSDPDAGSSPAAHDGGSRADVDADVDAEVSSEPDGAIPSGPLDRCAAADKKRDDFIAMHRSCAVDTDCVIVGDCGHADFRAVQRAYQEEAQRLALATCGAQDGPTYNAVCKQGQCDRVRSVAWCGGQPQSECPAGTTRRYPGCSEPAPSFAEGCYADCGAVGNNTGCAAGYTCQKTTIDPCRNDSCDACGQEVTLCLPAPACEVEVALGFDYGKTVVKVPGSESTQLELWLNNKTDRTLDLRFEVPCHGPVVSGLGDYDLWNSCLAGVCAQDTDRVELSLKPKEKLRWRTAVVQPAPSTCNSEGLAAGSYAPTFSLGISGAVSCGPAPAGLIVTQR